MGNKPRILLLAAGLLFALPVGAEDLFDLPLESLLQINITSTSYFDQTLLESASSVSHSDQANWDRMGARNVGEVLNNQTSTITAPGYQKSRVIAIRGYYNVGVDSGVATLLDDVPLNTLHWGTGAQSIDGFDLATLSSLELTRGPGSSLHGADAFHGVIAMNSLEHGPTGVVTRLTLGTEQEQAASLTSRYRDDRQQLTTSLAYRNIGDQSFEYPYIDPVSGQQAFSERSNGLENQNLSIKYSADVSAQTRVNALGYLMDMDADQLPGLGRLLGPDFMAGKDWSELSSRIQLFKTGLDHEFSPSLSTSVFAYYWQSMEKSAVDLRETFDPLRYYAVSSVEESHSGLKAINKHKFDGGSNLAYGYAYNRSKIERYDYSRQFATGSTLVIPSPQDGVVEDYHSLLLDGRYQFKLIANQHSTVVYGARVDDYSHYDPQISPRLGYLHGFDQHHSAKIMVSRAYRKPNTFEAYGTDTVATNPELEPETLDNIELVFQHSDANLFLSATAFRSRWQDSIRYIALPTPINGKVGIFQNTGENKAWGLELEARAHWQRWQLNANASHIQSRDVDLGRDFEAFPDWMLNLGIGYAWSPRWELYVLNRYHHRNAASAAEYGEQPSHGSETFLRTDVTLSWKVATDLSTTFTVRNLFDRENYMPGYSDRISGLPDNGINGSLSLVWQPFP